MPDAPELVLFDTMSVLQNFGDRYRYLARARAWRERRQQRPACSRRRGGGAALACPQRFLAHHVSRLARTISLVYTG